MAEIDRIAFTYKELAECLVKRQGFHEGIWGVYVRFGMQATNLGQNEMELLPTAILPLIEIGLQKVEKENNLAVDAARVNPDIKTPNPSRRTKKKGTL